MIRMSFVSVENLSDKRQSVVSTPKPEPAIIATKNESHVEESAVAVGDNAVKVEEEDVRKSQVHSKKDSSNVGFLN